LNNKFFNPITEAPFETVLIHFHETELPGFNKIGANGRDKLEVSMFCSLNLEKLSGATRHPKIKE
jgi:hypothetical protein